MGWRSCEGEAVPARSAATALSFLAVTGHSITVLEALEHVPGIHIRNCAKLGLALLKS